MHCHAAIPSVAEVLEWMSGLPPPCKMIFEVALDGLPCRNVINQFHVVLLSFHSILVPEKKTNVPFPANNGSSVASLQSRASFQPAAVQRATVRPEVVANGCRALWTTTRPE